MLDPGTLSAMLRGLYSLFERALAELGSDYTAQAVWERYIAYEAALSEHRRAAALYSRALRQPLKNLDGLLAQCVHSPPRA